MDGNESQESPSHRISKRAAKRRPIPPLWVWIVLAAAAAAIAVIRGTDLLGDHALANVITLIVGFLGLMAVVVWFALRSSYSRRARITTLAVLIGAIAVLAALFQIDHVSGELVPRFALRFSRKPDELLAKPKPAEQAGQQQPAVDLRSKTDYDFPQFLGPGRDLSVDRLTLARDWDARPPQLVWRQQIGAGWSGFSVVNGYAVTMEQRGDSEMVTCCDATTGDLLWFHSIVARYESKLAGVGPRATPTIDEAMVYTLGATAHLLCLDGATGRCVWEKDLLEQYGVTEEDEQAEVPYGRANSPLVVDDLVIVPAGGTEARGYVSLVAYDKQTGELVWEGGNRQVSYSSPALATLLGVRQILIVNQDYAGGHDPKTGKLLWEFEWPGKSASNANVSQAVPVPPDRVFLSKGYGGGASLVRLVPNTDGTFRAEDLWHSSKVLKTKFTNVAIRDGYVYGLSDGILECVELKSGGRMWKGGRYGHGQILLVGDLLLLSAESGEVFLVEATPDRPNSVLGHFQAIEGMTWNNLALFGPLLLVRNAQEAACYELPLAEPP